MDWNGLKIFIAIAETGSLSRAAEVLGVNHSTVFRRLRSLEADIGVNLLEKIENKYVLTPVGENMFLEGRKISDMFDNIDRQIIGADIKPKGLVKITAPYNIVNRYLPRFLFDFSQQHPEIKINFLSSNLDLNLNNRQADIAIRATTRPPEYLVGRKLCQIPWGIYCSPEYIKNNDAPKSLEDLKEHKLIGANGAMLNLNGFAWLEEHHAERITVRCDELTAMSYFAQYEYGLAFLPMDQERDGIVKIMDYTPGSFSDLWLLIHPDLRKTERIRLVMTHLQEAFKSLDWSG